MERLAAASRGLKQKQMLCDKHGGWLDVRSASEGGRRGKAGVGDGGLALKIGPACAPYAAAAIR